MKTLTLTLTAFLLTAGGLHASHPAPSSMEWVQGVAEDVEATTRQIVRQAEDRRLRGDRDEAYALKQLRDLEQRAEDFRRRVDRSRSRPQRTEEDYHELYIAYAEAARSLPALHAAQHVDREFQRLGELMSGLDRLYLPTYAWLGLESERLKVPADVVTGRRAAARPTLTTGGSWSW